ncbi:MAG: hypothetical protein H7Y88_05625, partial [Phycisphaerales bacterium]|nr:hypothetical protein [Phycisphaerales bacterium]
MARAVTLLEVVFAVLLMTTVALAIISTIAFIARLGAVNEQTLAAYEVGNRLLLQNLDDPEQMPDARLPLAYGERHRFAWEFTEEPVRMKVKQDERTQQAEANVSMSRYRLATVRVYDYEQFSTGGGRRGEELAVLTRLYDPFGVTVFRNKDVTERVATSAAGLRRIMESINPGGGEAAPMPPGEQPRGSRTAPERP